MIKDVFYQLDSFPRMWFLPRHDRAILAIIGSIFWGATIYHALAYHPANASVLSLFGLGLLYVVFSLYNLTGGLLHTSTKYIHGRALESHLRSLIELFIVLLGMLLCNALVFFIYVAKGATVTPIDLICFAAGSILLLLLVLAYGRREFLKHPIARGWLAIIGKTIPQTVMAILFIIHPSAAAGLALITLLGIDLLSTLRFIPVLKAYFYDKQNSHIKGLLLGEAGNTLSGILLTLTWFGAYFT
ncbi:MAG TPA: hypothetical protein VFT59_02530 [Candidatus Saccharimonadales bacterium]|nr:hypothetical protein [Candidatus Saccharimonadales bacterium]